MNVIGYTFITLFIGLLSYGLTWKAVHIINGNSEFVPNYSSYIQAFSNFGHRSDLLGLLIFLPFFCIFPLLVVWLFFRDAGSQQYTKSDDKHFWLKSALLYVLPGEIIRFLLCIIPINLSLVIPKTAFGNLFGISSCIIFELLYARPAGRLDDLSLYQYSNHTIGGRFVFADYLLFSIIHLAALSIYISIFLLIYRRSWKRGAVEYETIYGSREITELPIHENSFIYRKLDKLESRSPQIKEIVVNAFTVFMSSTAIGLASNAFILFAGWIFTFPAFDYGLSNLSDQFLWALWGSIGMSVCMIGIYPCGKYIGSQAADFRIGYKLSPKLNLSAMIISILSGLALHGLICVLLSISSPADCFIAGPVQYFSRLLGHGERSLFIIDSFDYPKYYTFMAIGLYLSLMGIMISSGYVRGHKKRMVFVAEKERAMAGQNN